MSERGVEPDPALALLEVYDAALPEVYGYLLARCGDRAAAEELTSETFLGAVTSLREPGAPSLSVAWLVGIARHKLVDHWRRRGREQRLHEAVRPLDEAHDPWDRALDAVRARDVLDDLVPEHREALVLRHVDGLAVTDVASALGRTVAATESVLSRARAAFRARYDPDAPTDRTPTDRTPTDRTPTDRTHRGGAQP